MHKLLPFLQPWPRTLLVSLTFFVSLFTLPVWWCGRGAEIWLSQSLEPQKRLANSVIAEIEKGVSKADFHTGHDLYSAEWAFGSYLMAGIGLCQMVEQHPETFPEYSGPIEQSIRELLSPRIREFDTNSWENDALETLESEESRGHAAYLGYMNFLLSLYGRLWQTHRSAQPFPFEEIHAKISKALQTRMALSPNGLIETYPDEWYPVDNAPGLASLLLRAETNKDSAMQTQLLPLVASYKKWAVDPGTGLLLQSTTQSGERGDHPRGSGTALSIFFLGRVLPDFTKTLYQAVETHLQTSFLGFGAVREYPRGTTGYGDIDSGPVIPYFGWGFSASGFTLAGSRMCGNQDFFRRLYASGFLVGAPVNKGNTQTFITGGPLGNSILLAMLTAPTLKQ